MFPVIPLSLTPPPPVPYHHHSLVYPSNSPVRQRHFSASALSTVKNWFWEIFYVQNVFKRGLEPKKDLRIDSNRSNPTVKAKVCPQNGFEQDLEQNRGGIQEE